MVRRKIPAELASWLSIPLGDEYNRFEQSIQEDPVTGLRTNPYKLYPLPWPTHPIPWHPDGHFLDARPTFTLDPGLHAGAYYVQDPSTMLLYSTLREAIQGTPKRILDLCAAPGGKSTLIASLLRPDDLLIANEIVPQRYHILHENLTKWGIPNVVTLSARPEQLQDKCPALFDVILVDAPCSGEGMFRKEPIALEQWSTGLVQQCALRQESILEAAWGLLAPGGSLIYATCTYNHYENLDQVNHLLREFPEASSVPRHDLPANVMPVTTGDATGYQCWPHRISGEGFFFSVLIKAADTPLQSWKKPKLLHSKVHSSLEKVFTRHISDLQGLAPLDHHNMLYAIPSAHLELVSSFLHHFPQAEPVTGLGQLIGQQFKPHPALALSTVYQGSFPDLELELDQALVFLAQKPLPISAPPGWLRITYQSLGLGWAKSVGNRLNNYYPKHWRIRHLPREYE